MIKLADDESAAALSFGSGTGNGSEGDAAENITVSKTGSTEFTLKTTISVSNATATDGNTDDDYDLATSGGVAIASGATQVLTFGPSDTDQSIEDAVDFIADLRQINDFSSLPIGRNVVVIGGGMTAIDAAVQSQLLGAEKVTIIYRRNLENMSASKKEQNNATSKGVKIITNAIPTSINKQNGVHKLSLSYTEVEKQSGKLKELDQKFSIEADQIFCAIGQKFNNLLDVFKSNKGKIMIDESCKTSVENVWAGGDCVDQGEDLTVTAVAQGRDAAEAIHKSIISK